ncbi:MAG: hypothetical protein F4W89_16640 [Acidobacteria bacterium]|nr:hypothetical protein [Acidobacteriota bacterium]
MDVKTVEERLSVVEHKVVENANRIDGLREAIAELGDRMDHRFDTMEQRFDRRCESMEQRFDHRCESMEQRFDRRFLWLTGTLAATMLAVVSVLSAALLGG